MIVICQIKIMGIFNQCLNAISWCNSNEFIIKNMLKNEEIKLINYF